MTTQRERYVATVLDTYRSLPGVLPHVRRADREAAGRLYDQDVPFHAVSTAFLLALARRTRHNAFAAPLPAVRSLHYFLPVVREVLERPLGYREIAALRREVLGTGCD